MAKKFEYEAAPVHGNVERLKERLQRFAEKGVRYVGSAQNVVIMERKAKSQDEDEGEEEE